jgi:enamine deaminase RidA (YjgF/YER057c/UK114 family)
MRRMAAEDRLRELGIELPEPLPVAGVYVPAKREGDLVFLAGHGPVKLDRSGLVTGKVGRDVSVDEARDAARLTTLHMLSTLRAELGSLDRVRSVVKVLGMVNGAPGFDQTPTVIDGCSQLLVDVFGDDAGRHARSAVGLAELPFGMAVEIEMVVGV